MNPEANLDGHCTFQVHSCVCCSTNKVQAPLLVLHREHAGQELCSKIVLLQITQRLTLSNRLLHTIPSVPLRACTCLSGEETS